MKDNNTKEYDYGLHVQEETVFNNGLCRMRYDSNGSCTRRYDRQQWIIYKMVRQSTMDYVQEEKHTKTAEIKQDQISDVHQ
jgi:hypothetical protein